MPTLPKVVLWAWERPEDLRFIDPQTTGVAYLARTIFLDGDTILDRPRLQPLWVPPGTRLIAVTRVETSRRRQGPSPREASPAPSAATAGLVASLIAEFGHFPAVVGVQVDFDATSSERAFYRALLVSLRQQLPASMPLSITALASWCQEDTWLADLPIDEAVPMLFRMGAGDREVRLRLAEGTDFAAPVCRKSLGLSTDEPPPPFRRFDGRRVYIFHPRPWSRTAARKLAQDGRP
ncbi:MAG TPA: DUF3142 domain-containing protein [Candidatus Acidoferrales bacterium]|nr:DUF3142 domain-containing protein [Candidatus Acidoferrales bacterium]